MTTEITKKKNSIAIVIITLLVVTTLGYYFWLQFHNTADRPPILQVPKQTMTGEISGDLICKIPGLYAFSDTEVTSYATPTGTANTLSAGMHFYHSYKDLSVSDIMKSIQPASDNKIMIAYYPSLANSDSQFKIYPTSLQGAQTVGADYKIPASEGFMILSCKDSKIYNISDEKTAGTGLPISLSKSDADTHWILFSGWKDGSNTFQKQLATYNIKSIWTQSDAGFNFVPANIHNMGFNNNDFLMVWAEVYAKANVDYCNVTGGSYDYSGCLNQQAASGTATGSGLGSSSGSGSAQKTVCEQNPACTSHLCIPYKGGYTCRVETTPISDNGAASLGQSYAIETSKKPDYCDISGNAYNHSDCLNQQASAAFAASEAYSRQAAQYAASMSNMK